MEDVNLRSPQESRVFSQNLRWEDLLSGRIFASSGTRVRWGGLESGTESHEGGLFGQVIVFWGGLLYI